MTRRPDGTPLVDLAEGEWCWHLPSGCDARVERVLCFRLPGEISSAKVEVHRSEHGAGVWRWMGTEDRPTLSPSLHVRQDGFEWHGRLVEGVWRDVGGRTV